MKKTLKTLTTAIAACIIALAFGSTANAGGAHFGFNVSLPLPPLPPLPPIPVPFGFVDVNPVYVEAPTVYVPAPRIAPAYGYTYHEPHRRHYRQERREARHDWREAKRDARRAFRDARRELRSDFREARRELRSDFRERRREFREAHRDWRRGAGDGYGWR